MTQHNVSVALVNNNRYQRYDSTVHQVTIDDFHQVWSVISN